MIAPRQECGRASLVASSCPFDAVHAVLVHKWTISHWGLKGSTKHFKTTAHHTTIELDQNAGNELEEVPRGDSQDRGADTRSYHRQAIAGDYRDSRSTSRRAEAHRTTIELYQNAGNKLEMEQKFNPQ